MKFLVLLPILLFTIIPAYAESTFLEDAIHDGLDGLGNTLGDSISGSGLNTETKTKLYKASESGIKSANLFTSAWFSAHEFMVNLILGGTPVPLPVTIITMISVGVSTFLIILVFREIWKKAKWVVLIVVAVILILLALGSSPTF